MGRTLKTGVVWTELTCMISAQPPEVVTRSNIAHRWVVDADAAGQVYIQYFRFSRWPNGDLNVGVLGLYGMPRGCADGTLVLATSIPALRSEFVTKREGDLLDTITCSTGR